MKVLTFGRRWLLVIELYKYESLHITVTLSLRVTMESSFLVARQVDNPRQHYKAMTCTHTTVLACGSAMRMHHLLVTLSVEIADANIAQKAYYRPNTNNRSNNRCITRL